MKFPRAKKEMSPCRLSILFAILIFIPMGVRKLSSVTPVTMTQSDKSLRDGRPPMQIPSANRDLVAEVSGGYEAQYFFQRLEKPADWDQNLDVICELKQRAVQQAIDRLEKNLADLRIQEL